MVEYRAHKVFVIQTIQLYHDVVCAGYVVALDDFGYLLQLAYGLRLQHRILNADRDEGADVESQRLGVDDKAAAEDYARAFELLDTLVYGRSRHAALARYLQKGRAGVLYQELQYLAVDLVDRPVLVVVHFGEALRFQYTKFLADLDEGLDATVELLDAMACRYLYAYARLTLRHNRIVESRDEDALLLQACGEVLR